jgi:hypothetical protein
MRTRCRHGGQIIGDKFVNSLETAQCAARGFSEWLKSSTVAEPEAQELKEQLLHVLEVYDLELQRQIEGSRANQDWFSVIALVSMTAALLRDGLIEATPELATYDPTDEPQSTQQMGVRLLSDALVLFRQTQDDLATYLDRPTFTDALDALWDTIQVANNG